MYVTMDGFMKRRNITIILISNYIMSIINLSVKQQKGLRIVIHKPFLHLSFILPSISVQHKLNFYLLYYLMLPAFLQ